MSGNKHVLFDMCKRVCVQGDSSGILPTLGSLALFQIINQGVNDVMFQPNFMPLDPPDTHTSSSSPVKSNESNQDCTSSGKSFSCVIPAVEPIDLSSSVTRFGESELIKDRT